MSIGKWTPKYTLLYEKTKGNNKIKYMYLYLSLSKRTVKTEKNVEVVACPDMKLKLCGFINILKRCLISGSLLGLNLSTESLIRFVN